MSSLISLFGPARNWPERPINLDEPNEDGFGIQEGMNFVQNYTDWKQVNREMREENATFLV